MMNLVFGFTSTSMENCLKELKAVFDKQNERITLHSKLEHKNETKVMELKKKEISEHRNHISQKNKYGIMLINYK